MSGTNAPVRPSAAARQSAPVRLWYIAALSLFGLVVAVGALGAVSATEPWVQVVVALAVAAVVAVVRVSVLRPDRLINSSRTKEELAALVSTSTADGRILARSAELVNRSTRFYDTSVAEILTPRTSVQGLAVTCVGADLAAFSNETGLSRALVHAGDLDDIVGVVHVKALLHVPAPERAGVPLSTLCTDVVMVPQTLSLQDLLVQMRAARSWLAVVLDEYGGTSGIVTIEDVIEALVGEIDDEHDRARVRRPVVRLAGTSVLSGDLNLTGVREHIGLELPEGPYETLGGFVMDRLGCVPTVGDSFEFAAHRFDVLEMDRRRVAAVRIGEPPSIGSGRP